MMRHWQALGHTVSAVTVFSGDNAIPEPPPYKVYQENIPGDQLGIQWGIYKVLKKYSAEADVFHLDGQVFLYGAGLYRLLGGKAPVVGYFNRELTAWPINTSLLFSAPVPQVSVLKKIKRKLRWILERTVGMAIASKMDFFTFTNPFLEEAYRNFGLKTTGRFMLIGDPFDIKKTMQESGVTTETYSQKNKTAGPIILFYSSRMVAGKGFDLLVTAFAKVKNKENFKLVLGGTGPEEADVHALVQKLGLEPYVEFPGWMSKEELHRQLKAADIFVQARWRRDMSSMSLTEAMCFGLPSIIPGGGGIAWVGGKSSVCFTPDDAADLARTIEAVGANAELRKKLSRACYERLDEANVNYEKTLPAVADKMQELVEKNKK
jgi:glycosyltransferase involved in cell wall biosynthesis